MDLLALALFILVAIIVWFLLWENSEFVRLINKMPGPPKVPYFGNVFGMPLDGYELLQKIDVKWVKTYGRIYRVWRGLHSAVNISSPEHAEVMLTSQKNINKSFSIKFLKPWLGDGLLSSGGDKWKRDRRLLTPAFHFQILDGFFDVFNRNANIFIGQINTKLREGPEVNIYPLASRCTLDVICEAAMGVQINAQLNSNSEYISAIDKVESCIQERINSFLIILPDWFYNNFTSHGRKFNKHLKIVHGFTLKTLRKRRALFKGQTENEESATKKRRAFLDLLLQSVCEGARLSDKDILNQVDTFMFAVGLYKSVHIATMSSLGIKQGHDTTSAAISWFLYCMALNQHIQNRVYEEIISCFDHSDRPCVLEDLAKLKYLDCCVKESLRLYPPAPLIRRHVDHETEAGGYKIPTGTNFALQIYALHRNGQFFPDPLRYNPDRFSPENSIGRHPFSFVPFSAGPRNCIGQKFGLFEDKVILVNLLRKFHFDINPANVPVKEAINIILKPQGGMPLNITPRNSS